MSKIYRATVQEDKEGNPFIELKTELLNQLGWKEGDEIEWEAMPVDGEEDEYLGAFIYKVGTSCKMNVCEPSPLKVTDKKRIKTNGTFTSK